MIKRNFAFRSREVVIKFYKSLVRPHLDYAMQAWSPHMETDKKIIEKVQARATKLIPNLKDLPYEDRLNRLNLTTLERRRQRGILSRHIASWTKSTRLILIQCSRRLYTFVFLYTRTRGHEQKFAKTRPRLDIRKHFYSQRVVEPWNKLPESATQAPTYSSALRKNWPNWVTNGLKSPLNPATLLITMMDGGVAPKVNPT